MTAAERIELAEAPIVAALQILQDLALDQGSNPAACAIAARLWQDSKELRRLLSKP
jgi:hypothetical protein